MNNSEKMIEIIEKKKELSNEKKPKYGTRKLSIGLVSCMLGFTLMISPILSIASDNANEEKISEIVNQEQSQSNSANQVEENIKATENKEELKFTHEQVKELKDAGYNENEINEILEEAKSKKAKDQNFKLIEFLKEKVKEKSDKNSELELGKENVSKEVKSSNQDREATPNPEKPNNVDAVSSATYYTKANWENKIKDKSRWKVEDKQNLVRVSGSDPVEMNDIDYDGMFIDGNGRYVIRLIYKEKSKSVSAVWHRALINFGDLDKYIDYDLSYVLGKDGKTQYKFDPVTGIVGRGFDLRAAAGDRTNNRANLPINLVLKEGINLKTLGSENYIVQMRVANGDYTRIYAYAPKGTSMDYSTYTKTTAVDLEDKLGTLFIKGGKQSDLNNATNQEFFMSEFISNPAQYNDKLNLGIIRTQYTGQGTTIVRDTVGGQPIAFTQVFDANLLKYMKADDKGNIGYVNVMTNDRKISPYSKNIGIKREMINVDKEKGLAYLVIGTEDFKKDGVKVVKIPQHDQYTKLSGFYITAIDYVVDKGQFENTFSSDKVRKLNYTTMSGWTNPNKDGWTIYEKDYDDDYVVPEGESYLIDTGDDPTGGQIMLQIGGDQAILRKPQGYYNGYVSGDGANDAIEKYANGVYKITLREGATILKGKKLKLYMPYTSSHDNPVNFLEIHNGTKLNEGAATLTLQTDRNINMHLYTDKPRGASFKLKYTLANGDTKELVFTKPKGLSTFWQFKDTDKVLTGLSNTSIISSGGNFYINTKKLQKGADIVVEAYDENGNKIESETSWFKYVPLTKSDDNVKNLTWTDHSDKKSVLSINKSLYTPYQKIFTNDYEEGNVYKNPKAVPTNEGDFNKDTTEIVGYTKYDGGKIRTLYENRMGSLIAKTEAGSNDYDDKGNLKGPDVRKDIKINKDNIFDSQFDEAEKLYRAYEYRVNLAKMLAYQSDDKTEHKLELLKDMKFVSNASDGSSLPSDLFESRVRARILFDTTEGAWEGNSTKSVRIVPDNVKFYGDEGYVANGFEGANVEVGTGDKFPDAPKAKENKNFLGWVTAEGKKALGKTTVSAEEFNKLRKDQIFKADTPVTKHLVVYAIYSEDTTVTFDANGGKFADDKGQNTVKVDGGNVTPLSEPTKEGYNFKGWADSKDATKANPNILTGVTSSKTVYAVWEKKAEEPLVLKNPQEKVEVKDLEDVSIDEKDKIKDAVIKANPDLKLTKDDITVSKDGTVTVNKGGKTGTISKDNTVTQKLVENNFNPPKEPVKVENAKALTEDEIKQVKQAVKDANPERNFKDEDLTVDADGTVKINQSGKVGTITPDKTVVQKDTILDLKKPADKVEVKNPDILTQEEKKEVAKKVKEANDTLGTDAKVDVDSKGNVTVKDGEKTGTLEAKDTVKPFTRDGKTLNPPAKKVKVGNHAQLTELEKQAVRDEIKKANPDLGFTDDEIQVDDNGTVTVPITDSKNGTFQPEQTIEEAKDTDKIIKLVAPAKTQVVNASKLTEDEKKAVIAAIKDANKNLPEDVKIEVADDGSVTVTQGTGDAQKVGQLDQKDTVEEKLKSPIANAKDDGSLTTKPANDDADKLEISYTDPSGAEKKLTATKGQDGKWTLPQGTDKDITIDPDKGEVTIPSVKIKNKTDVKVTAKGGEKTSDPATVTSNDTKAPGSPQLEAKPDGGVKITPPEEADTKTVKVEYKDKDGNPQTLIATKADGKWTLPQGTDTSITIDPKSGVITLPKGMAKAGEKVTAKATDINDNTSKEGEAEAVDKKPLQDEVDKNKDDAIKNLDKYKNADQEKKAAYDKALGDANKVLQNPKATQAEINKAKADLENAANALDGKETNKDKLREEVNKETSTKDSDKYKNADKGLKDAYDKALEEAKKVLNNPKASQEDVDKAKKALDDASNALNGQDSSKPKAPEVSAEENGDVKITPPEDDKVTKIEVTYKPKNGGDPVTITVTKENGTWKLPDGTDTSIKIDNSGNITIKDGLVAENTEVKVVAKDSADNKSDSKTAKVPSLADKMTPAYTEADAQAGSPTTITGPNFTDKNNSSVAIPAGTTFKLGDDAPTGATIDANGEVKYTPSEEDAGKEIKIPVVVKYSDGSSETVNVTVTVAPKAGQETTINAPKSPITVDNAKALTKDDKDKVKKAVEDANKDGSGKSTLPEGATIDVADDGTVTIKDKDGKEIGTIKPEKTVKQDDSKLGVKAPTPVEVANPNDVTTEEQGKIKAAVIAANPDLADATITVDNKGNVTVTKDGKTGKLTPEQTVKKAGEETKIKDPANPITVDNAKALTKDDKDKVKKAVEDANPNLPEGATIEVADDGSVTIKDKTGKEIGKISPDKTVKQKENKLEINSPENQIGVENPKSLSEKEKEAVKEAVKKSNPNLPEGATIEVSDDGSVTIKDKTGKEIGKISSDKTVKQKENKLEIKIPESIKVKNKDSLSNEDKQAIKDAIKKANPELNLTDEDIIVADDGSVKVKKNGKEASISADKLNIFSKGEAEVHDKSELKIADLVEPKASKKIKVKDKNNLTNEEKEKIQKSIKEANKNNFPQGTKVVVNNDGSVDIIYPDGSKDSIKASKLVEEESVETGKLTKKVKKDKDAKDNSNGKSKNISTGIESQAGIIATLIGSVGGLFASRKKKNK